MACNSRLLTALFLSALLLGPETLSAQSAAPNPIGTAEKTVTTRLTLVLPQADTDVVLDGRAIDGVGREREVESVPLVPEQIYQHEVSVRWRPNNYTALTRTVTVRLRAGDISRVDMSVERSDDRAEIRFVPTPDHIVSEMISLAKIGASDVVFEPGCGDARITIAAVKAGARRGVGIDIDPDRVVAARANVDTAGLKERVEIRLADALKIEDLSQATVVFLYMGEEFDLLLRPILWQQLPLGSRIVSHRFRMGDWEPDQSVNVSGFDEDDYTSVHLWTITEEVKRRAAQ